ncbi:hypothetical protein A8135_05095 [Legionella jamestowniensis]|uniref:Ankyrin repeats (3 copies) n=1 Tax=Legionella jamestowniensis TaxID=455 RepID=A0ABX2XR30_9GAMM|nr:hypothetical protein [Legionella jamestowniensis]OCH97011.1 hypothetical protein A8135_05095 [Legionella jamestowniensis]
MARSIDKSSEFLINTLTFKEAIANFAYKLSAGSSDALIAIVEFKELIDNVTDSELKDKILGLSINVSDKPVSLMDVLLKINKGMCVKRAAHQITKILNENIANDLLEINLDSAKKQNAPNQCLILFTIVQDIDEGLKAIKKYLNPLGQEKLLNVLKEKNYDQNSLLHIAARDSNNNQRLLAILMLIDPKFIAEIAQERNCNGDPLIHLLVDKNDKFASYKELLSLIPSDDRLQAINAKDRLNGDPILHNLATLRNSPEGMMITLESLPKEVRLEAIKTTNEDGNSLLDILVKNSNEKCLQAILAIVPEAKTEIDELISKKTKASEYSASFINTMTRMNNTSGESPSKNNQNTTSTGSESKTRWVMPKRRRS